LAPFSGLSRPIWYGSFFGCSFRDFRFSLRNFCGGIFRRPHWGDRVTISADILLERVGATHVTNLTARAGNALFAMRDGGWVPLWQEGGVGGKTIRYLLAFGLVERQWRTRSLVYDFYRLTPSLLPDDFGDLWVE
jgi:hypothetical protein